MERGVLVTNTPGVLDDATADLAFALILAMRRRLVEGDRLVREGRWAGAWPDGSLAEEVAGSTLGIVGLGRIGSRCRHGERGASTCASSTRSAGESRQTSPSTGSSTPSSPSPTS